MSFASMRLSAHARSGNQGRCQPGSYIHVGCEQLLPQAAGLARRDAVAAEAGRLAKEAQEQFMTPAGPVPQLGHWLKMNAAAARRPCYWKVQDFGGGSLRRDVLSESK